MLRPVYFIRSVVKASRIANTCVGAQLKSRYSTNPDYPYTEEPYEVFHDRFLNAFNNQNLDSWWLRRWMELLHHEDAVPPPDIVCAGLKACRRQNDLALAIRFLESCKLKASSVKGAWPWLQKEIAPTMKELGIPTLSELGYEQPELWVNDENIDESIH